MQQKPRIGVIGAGGIANGMHLPALRDAGAEIAAICDRVPERAETTADKFAIAQWYQYYPEMFAKEQLDAVFVLVEPDQTFRIVNDSLDAGLHVFSEKPPGVTCFQAESLMRKAEASDRILQVGFNRRYIPLVQHVFDIMRDTTEITQVEGAFLKHGSAAFLAGSISAFVSDTIHAVDLVRWMSGGTASVCAMMEAQNYDVVPNTWNALIRFDNNVTGIVKANYQIAGRVHSFELHGPEASAYINLGFGDMACDARIIYYRGRGSYSLSSAGPGKQSIEYIDGRELAGSEESHRYYGFYQEDVEFLRCVEEGVNPMSDIKEGVETMRLVEQLLQNRI